MRFIRRQPESLLGSAGSWRGVCSSEPPEHDADHGKKNEGDRRWWPSVRIAGQRRLRPIRANTVGALNVTDGRRRLGLEHQRNDDNVQQKSWRVDQNVSLGDP